jgi:hypothetical protein
LADVRLSFVALLHANFPLNLLVVGVTCTVYGVL